MKSGELVQILLMPGVFGGTPIPPNMTYVPAGFDQAKAALDGTMLNRNLRTVHDIWSGEEYHVLAI